MAGNSQSSSVAAPALLSCGNRQQATTRGSIFASPFPPHIQRMMHRSKSAMSLSASTPKTSRFGGIFEDIEARRSAMSSRAASPTPNSSVSQIKIEPEAADDVFASVKPVKMAPDSDNEGSTSSKLAPTTAIFTPRADRTIVPLTPENAQGLLPPDACVFVANLSMQHNDLDLQAAVLQVFKQFGDCAVKIRRDKHRHPFALVQYYDEKASRHAIVGGNGLIIQGRKMRCEKAQAQRSVILTRIDGATISEEEARKLLEQYGPIDRMRATTNQDATQYNLPSGMYVQYAYYDDFKDCFKQFNNNALYKVVVAPNITDLHIPKAPANMTMTPNSEPVRTPRSITDQKSVFVGNLPEDATEKELVEIFSQYGEIKGCNVIRKHIHGGHGHNVFGFVEFATPEQAVEAIQELDIRGKRVRVEPKEYSARRNTRLAPAPYGPPPADRSRAYGWAHHGSYGPHGPQGNDTGYQGHGLPFGFQPVYVPQHPGMYPYQQVYGYGPNPTPPRTGQRQQPYRGLPAPPGYGQPGPTGYNSGYNSPPQFAPSQLVPPQHSMPPANAFGPQSFAEMSEALGDIEAEGHLHPPPRRY